jgi:hypothetical protein
LERPELADLNDTDLPIILAALSFISREVCSLDPFCFWGTMLSTSLTFGLEFMVLKEFDFNNAPTSRNTNYTMK